MLYQVLLRMWGGLTPPLLLRHKTIVLCRVVAEGGFPSLLLSRPFAWSVTKQTCLLCHKADKSAETEQTCLLCYAGDMFAVSHSRQN